MIQVTNLGKRYGSPGHPLAALEGVSFAIAPGEFAALAGRSGSGKTTLLSLIAGLARPSSGAIRLFDRDLARLGQAGLSRLRGARLGFVFQFPSLLSTISALANVGLPLRFSNSPDPGRPRELLEKVGLAERLHSFPHQLSAGEVRRVALARALVNRPQLILADEPTGDLDPETEQVIISLLEEAHQQGATLLMATHNPDLAARASRTLRLSAGRLTGPESPAPSVPPKP